MSKLGKALENMEKVKRIIMENSCPSEFGLEDCEYNSIKNHCCVSCEQCWNEEVEE